MLRAILCVLSLLIVSTYHARATTGPGDGVVIIYAQFPGTGQYEIGTGLFVDHDGLVLTADHVIHHIQMASPVTHISGSLPTGTEPTSIFVYSTALQARFKVDLSTIVGGTLDSNDWMDVAFLRVKLTDVQRAKIAPLNLTSIAPSQTESLTAFGPLCTRLDEQCYQPSTTATSLSNDPTLSRDYQVRATITTGFSGGPLVNTAGLVVAIDSWGDLVSTNQITRASYVPSTYILRYFLDRVPPSSILNAQDACTTVHSLASLTVFDQWEVSKRWQTQSSLLQDQAQCACCCESLDKTANPMFGAPLVGGSCQPPFCPQRRLFGIVNSIAVALATKAVDSDTSKLYEALKATVDEIPFNQLSKDQQKTIYETYGHTLSSLSESELTRNDPAFKDARTLALGAFWKGQKIEEDAGTYEAMGRLFKAAGDVKNAQAADILGIITASDSHLAATQLKINPDVLRKSVERGSGKLEYAH